MKVFLISIIVIFITGCANNSTKNTAILEKEKMQVVLWDIMQANSFTEHFIVKDTIKNAQVANAQLQQKIFKLHNTSREQFYRSYNYYSSKPELMKTLLDSITAKGERGRTKMIERKYNTREVR